MNCENMKELLNAYIDNLLSGSEREAVEEHIASCPSCREELDELMHAVKLVRSLDRIVPPPWFSEQVMINIRKEEEKKKGIISRLFRPFYIKLPIEVFATVVIAVLAIYIYRSVEPEWRPLTYSPQAVQESPAPPVQAVPDNAAKTGPHEADKLTQTTESPASEKASGREIALPKVKQEEKALTAPVPEAKVSAVPEKKHAAPSVTMKEKNEMQYDLESPGLKSMEKSKDQSAGVLGESLAEEEKKDGSAAPAPQMQMKAAPSPVMIDVSVTVADKEKAIRDISGMLEAMKARVIGKYSSGMDTAILAEANGTDAKKLIEKLGASGDVTLITRYPDFSGNRVVMRIKVISRQPQVKP
jgi:hypothetical protein